MRKSVLLSVLLAQLSAKLIGVSVLAECPTPEIVAVIQEAGQALGADFTDIPYVLGSSSCPATEYGPMWGLSQFAPLYDTHGQVEGTWSLRGGVTVGLHYKVAR